jgi:hypothetical protein
MVRFKQFLVEKKEYQALPGESEVVHHSSFDNFDKFHPLSHFGTHKAARERHSTLKFGYPEDYDHLKPVTYTARLKLGHVVDLPDVDADHSLYGIAHQLHSAGHISEKQRDHLHNTLKGLGDKSHQFGHELNKMGINTMRYENEAEDPGSKSYIITHPDQVRILKKSVGAKININRAN